MQLDRVREAPDKANTPPPELVADEFSEMIQSISLGEHECKQRTPPPLFSTLFCTIAQLLTVAEEASKRILPPSHLFSEDTQEPLPPVTVNPSRTDSAVSLLSKITTLPRLGSADVPIRIVVSSGPVSDITVMAFPLNVTGTVITYSPGATSTVSASLAASIPTCIVSKSWLAPGPTVIVRAWANPPNAKTKIDNIFVVFISFSFQKIVNNGACV
jgi:hypothetical protein